MYKIQVARVKLSNLILSLSRNARLCITYTWFYDIIYYYMFRPVWPSSGTWSHKITLIYVNYGTSTNDRLRIKCYYLRWRYRHQKYESFFINPIKGKSKGKVYPITGHEGPEGDQMYSSTLSSTSALDGRSGQPHASAALPSGTTRYPLYRRLGGPQVRFRRVRKISPPPRFDPRTVQPVASRFVDWAIPAPIYKSYCHSI